MAQLRHGHQSTFSFKAPFPSPAFSEIALGFVAVWGNFVASLRSTAPKKELRASHALERWPQSQSNAPPCNSKANLSMAEKARPANSSV